MKYAALLVLVFIILCNSIHAQDELKKNSISIWGSVEYGADLASVNSPLSFRDGFFHSAGFYYRRDFEKWYIRPGICYNQVLLSNSARTSPSSTVKVHRLGLSLSAGYYVYNRPRFRIGIGCGVQALYNIAGVRWTGSFNEDSVIHLNESDMFTWGLEFNVHTLFSYRVHPRWEIYGSPFVEMNVLSVFQPDFDNTIRAGASFGAGFLF